MNKYNTTDSNSKAKMDTIRASAINEIKNIYKGYNKKKDKKQRNASD